MSWPPTVGDRLPRAAEAYGITEKLVSYSLNIDHSDGGAKANGFAQILGITLADVDYLTDALLVGVLDTAITDVRENAPFGWVCEIRMPVTGLREKSDRVVLIKTAWHFEHADDRPRLVTAYITG